MCDKNDASTMQAASGRIGEVLEQVKIELCGCAGGRVALGEAIQKLEQLDEEVRGTTGAKQCLATLHALREDWTSRLHTCRGRIQGLETAAREMQKIYDLVRCEREASERSKETVQHHVEQD